MTEIGLREPDGHPPHPPDEDGAWKTWALGAIFTLLLGFAGAWGVAIQDQVAGSQRDIQVARERLANIEARADAIQRQIDANVVDLREAIRRIDAKLDRILENGGGGAPRSYMEGRRFDK